MLKISTDNGSVRNAFGDLEALDRIAAAGFDGVDFTFYEMNREHDLFALPTEQRADMARRIRERADQLGLAFPQAHAPFRYRHGEGEDSENYQAVLNSIEFASRIGCPQIVIHTLKFDKSTVSVQEADDINRRFLRSFLPAAEQWNVNIGVENLFHYDSKCDRFNGWHETPERMNAFVDSLESPRFKVCCDLGHAAITGVEPQAFIAGMDPDRLTMLHVQDTDYRHDTHTIPWLGKQNWEAIAEALARIGYRGFINLEVLYFYEAFPVRLYDAALRMASAAAHELAALVESRKGPALS